MFMDDSLFCILCVTAVCVYAALRTTDANFEHRKTAVLQCTSDNPGVKVYWESSNGTRVEAISPHKPARYEETANGSLIIWHPSRETAGLYYCCQDSASGKIRKPANFFAMFQVVSISEMSAYVHQGDDFVTTFLVFGHPKPIVNWYKDGTLLQPNSRITVEDTFVNRLPAQSLKIANVDFDERGVYTCEAKSSRHPDKVSTGSQRLRVTDRYGFTWPLIGIILEFLLISTIICISEYKKKNEESENQEEVEKQIHHCRSRNHSARKSQMYY